MPRKSEKPKKKRTNGEGTFYQKEDKTWVYQITLGRNPNGALKRKAFSGATKTSCLEKKKAFERQQEQMERDYLQEQEAIQIAKSKTPHYFAETFMKWLKLYKSPPTIKPTTYGTYIDIFNVHLCPYFGEMELSEIETDDVQAYYQAKQKEGARKDGRPGGLAPKTIRNHHMLLKDFFSYAKKKYKLDGNPTEDTNRPEVTYQPRRVLEPDEMAIFIQEVMVETQRVAILFGLFTGLRIGELLSLKISDINMKRQSFVVQRNLSRVRTDTITFDNPNIAVLQYNPHKKTHLIIQNTPKTKSSCREIPMSDNLCELVVRHLYFLKHSGWPNPDDLIFPSKVGTHIDPKSFELRLRAVSKRCEIKNVNPHALRHTFATRLVDDNVPLITIKNILGHSSIQTTQIYTHGNTELERSAITDLTQRLDIGAVINTPMIMEAQKRMKFSDVKLPNFANAN